MPANFSGEINREYYAEHHLGDVDFRRLDHLKDLEVGREAFLSAANLAYAVSVSATFEEYCAAAANYKVVVDTYVAYLLNNYRQMTTDLTVSELVSWEMFREYRICTEKFAAISDDDDLFQLLVDSPDEALEQVANYSDNEQDKALKVNDLLDIYAIDDVELFDKLIVGRMRQSD